MNGRTRGEKENKKTAPPSSFLYIFFVIKNWNDDPCTSETAHLFITWWSNKEQTHDSVKPFNGENKEPTISFTTRNKNTKITGFLFDVKSLWEKRKKGTKKEKTKNDNAGDDTCMKMMMNPSWKIIKKQHWSFIKTMSKNRKKKNITKTI